MGGKSKIILLSLTMLLTIVLTIFITFAWFDMINETKTPIIINTGSLRLKSDLYYLEDEEYIHLETGGIDFEGVIPGEEIVFKIDSINNGNVKGYLNLKINIVNSNYEFLKCFNVKYIDPSDSNKTEKIVGLDTIMQNNKIIFTNVFLDAQKVLEFNFTISVNQNMTSAFSGEVLTIQNFILNLNQNPY